MFDPYLVSRIARCSIAMLISAATALAAPPTDAQIDQAIKLYKSVFSGGAATHDAVAAAAKSAMAGLDMNQLSCLQIARLADHGSLLSESGQLDAAWARLRSCLPDRGPDGAAAAVRLLGTRLREAADEPAKLAILRETISHPGLESAVKQGGASRVLGIVSMEAGPLAPRLADDLAQLDKLITPDFAPMLAPDYTSYYELLQRAGAGSTESGLEPTRLKLVKLARGAAAAETDEPSRESLANTADYLDGRYIKGTLLNHPAPELTVLWCSDPAIRALADLKGRVVVLDFWATWCGPCVESLPAVKELQERYEDYPVSVVGVSSPQGSVVGLKGGITKADSEQHEFELMRGYMQLHSITWPLLFSRESVTNPDYGVRGIPHVVIIDPAGIVRHRALHPAQSLAKKAEKIDAILREFKLAAPEPLPVAPAQPSGG
ncbi:MAG: TlpA family protein disulfide reductase [Phycisphaerales bacterium]|nr:TlpA family protein disulfide reductase [Phycisphaerales bacterium]